MAINYWLDVDGNWTNVANWSLGAVPVSTNDVYILSGSKNIASNLNQSAVTLNSLTIGAGFTGTIGTTAAYLQISATTWTVGTPLNDGSTAIGSGRIKIDFGSVQYTGTVLATGSTSTDSPLESLRVLGTHASNKLYVLSGKVGVATSTPSEVSTLTEVDVVGSTALVNFGVGVTWATGNIANGGVITTQTAGTTLSIGTGSTATTKGTVAITTINNSGTLNHQHRAATADTTINNYPGGYVDFSGNPASTIITTFNRYAGSKHKVSAANPGHITITTLNLINASTVTVAA